MINAMNNLMLMGTKGNDAAALVKPAARESFRSEDAFAGIFREKMSDISHATRRTQSQVMDKPLMKADRESVREDKSFPPKGLEKTVQEKPTMRRPDENGRPVSDETSSKDKPKSKEESVSASEAMDVLNMLAALLESLFTSLEKVTEVTGETDGSQGQIASEAESSNPIHLLRLKLEGKLGELEKLLQDLDGSDLENSELAASLKSLLDQLDSLKATQETNRSASDSNLKLDVQMMTDGDESKKALLLKLKANGEDILDKLRLKITTLEKASGQAALPNADALAEGIAPNSTEDQSAGTNEKTDAKTEKVEARVEKHKESGDNTLQEEPIPAANQKPETDQIAAQPGKPAEKAELKAVKSEFKLSEKPLAQTVTNQVMLKVKLMAGEHKQEMEMHLKPESLGKLTLKIIHERGEIVARITAENEQVKAILETNMQMLKDSLEKSGLSVQSLSVSVGNGNEQSHSQNQDSQQKNKSFETGSLRQAEGRGNNPRSGIFTGPDAQIGSYNIDLTA